MATSEHEIDSFSEFAKSQLSTRGSDVSLDELFDEWRIVNPPPDDALAIKASLRDMERGETGRPFEEFADEIRKQNHLKCDE